MAQEEIKLVGSFKDDITPKLQKLNREITNIGRAFERFNKKISPVTKNFAKMAMSAKEFSNAMASQRNALDSSSRAMREYSKQAGKMTGAMRKVTEARMKAQRQMGMSRAEARKSGGGMVSPVASGKGGGGSAFGASAGQSFTKSVGAVAIGSAIGNMASNAIMSGVRGFGNLLKAPFSKFMGAFKERIGDEMDDIKSAGGLFALDMDLTQESGNERFFKNYNESLRFQEKLNIDMAESAAALPGVTSQYVSTSRQLTDTIQMVMEKDRESFNKMAARYGADISAGGVDASKNAMQTILKKQTEQVVLQSQGQQGGLPMHIAIQQLMGKEAKDGKIGVQAFTNKFRAAFQKNPLLKNFLLRAEKDLAATDAGSVERLQKIIEVFDAAMPKEVINKMRGSLSGMTEALRSGLLDPQAGLFGLSRAVFADVTKTGGQFIDSSGKLLKKNVNDFGEFIYKLSEDFNDTAGIAEELGLENVTNLKGQELTLKQLKKLGLSIDKQNRIVDEQGKVYGEISKSNTYLFEAIREILAGFGPPLLELVGFLPALFDPFTQMTTALLPLRDKAQEFIAGFNNNIDKFEEVAQAMAGSADAAMAGRGNILKQQSRGRAAIGKFVKFLDGVGGIDKELSGNILDVVESVKPEDIDNYDKNIVKFIEPLFRSILDSDFTKQIAKGAGQIVAGIIRTTYEMLTGAFSLAEGGVANNLLEGFSEGFNSMFEDYGGFEAIVPRMQELLQMALSKFFELAFKIAVPIAAATIQSLLIGLWNSSGIGKVLTGLVAAFAVSQVVAMMTPIFGLLGAVAGGLTKLVGVVSFVISNFALISGMVGTVFTAIIAPIAAVAGAIMGLVAIFRHMDFIVSSIVEAFKIVANGIAIAGIGLVKALTMLPRAILGLLDSLPGVVKNMIPGLNTILDGARKFEQGLDGAQQKLVNNIKESGQKIAKNTTDSFARTKEDAAKLKSMFTGMSGAKNTEIKATLAAAEAMQSLQDKAKAAGSSFENNKKFTGEDGKEYGWAMKDGEKILVEWGSILGETSEAAKKFTEALSAPVENGKVVAGGGMDQETADLINKLRGGNVHPTPPPTPASNPGIDSESGLPTAPKAPSIPPEATEAMTQIGQAAQTAAPPLGEMAPKITAANTELATIPASSKEVVASLDAANSALLGFVGELAPIPEQVAAILMGAATQSGTAITTAAQGLASALASAASSIKNAASASASSSTGGGGDKGKIGYSGHTPGQGGKMMPLAAAIEKEKQMMPSGADLLIANTSETVIPAFSGHVGDGFKGLSFAELESAAGFDRMKSYTEQIAEVADKTAAEFMGGMGGALGGGSATLNAMEALGNSMGLITTSGFRPGDPGFHGANRARDLSNGGGETPEMNKVANIMATKYGQSLTELIYTPLGYSIKNGQKTGLISPSNHYHHIHVAVAEGLAKAAVFNSQRAAEQYERSMMPSGAEPMKVNLASMTANSSEFGGGGVTVGDINVSVSGVDDPKAIANQVAEQLMLAIQEATHKEIFSS